MSDDESFVTLVNVVKPTSIPPSEVQGLQDANHSMSVNLNYLPPNSPAELIAALQKKIEPLHLFTEPFGTVNEYGETILFALSVKVCTVCSWKGFNIVNSEIAGEVAIIFHPDESKVFIIVHRNDSMWPCAKKELSSNTEFGINGCALDQYSSCLRLCPKQIIHNAEAGYLFEVQPSVFIKFSHEKELIQFKSVIRNLECRISMNRLPTNGFPIKESAGVMSQFWSESGLHPCSIKLLYLHQGPIWTEIDISKPDTHEHGIVALAQSQIGETLELITITKNVKKNMQVTKDFMLIPSDIAPSTKYSIWEWFVDYTDRNACGFITVKDAFNFKIAIDYYINALKKKNLSWDW